MVHSGSYCHKSIPQCQHVIASSWTFLIRQGSRFRYHLSTFSRSTFEITTSINKFSNSFQPLIEPSHLYSANFKWRMSIFTNTLSVSSRVCLDQIRKGFMYLHPSFESIKTVLSEFWVCRISSLLHMQSSCVHESCVRISELNAPIDFLKDKTRSWSQNPLFSMGYASSVPPP